MLLAGDLGGTKTLVGLFERATPRPHLVRAHEVPTLDFPGLGAIITDFLDHIGLPPSAIERASIGVAGPVVEQEVELTNVPWRVERREVVARTGIEDVHLLNDVEAMAYSVALLTPDELAVLQAGQADSSRPAVLITAGTGLGQAIIPRVNGRPHPIPSEGGHADFTARTPREVELLQALTAEHGRVDTERVVSGPGLATIWRLVDGDRCRAIARDADEATLPSLISKAALERRCDGCREALRVFVSALGAAAGNLALHAVARGGVYLGGGIPPKILPALREEGFLSAFRAKSPMEAMLAAMPVSVILDERAGLLGAAIHAAATV